MVAPSALFAKVTPALILEKNVRTSTGSSLRMPAVSPYSVLLARAIASRCYKPNPVVR